MAEVGIAYVLTGPDGSRAVVGNCDAAKNDPDFVGFLDPENGITGLLDTADVRESASDLVQADGGIHGAFYLSRRSGTVQGLILPQSEMPAVNAAIAKLKRATRALRADGVLTWTPSGGVPLMLRYRRQQRVAITGRRPKAFQAALVSADAYNLSASELNQSVAAGGSTGELGIANPITNPITSPLNVAAQQFIVNAGDAPSWPRFRIDGPITNPEIINQTTGERIRLVYVLNAGEWLDVYPERGQVLLGGSGDRYSAYDFSVSSWWQLQPGNNDVRLIAASYSAPAQLTVYWRHAFE
jgi:hypothetical protein